MRPLTHDLLQAALAGKDQVIADQRAVNAEFFELYERLGRVVALYLQDPELAKEEVTQLCDLEANLTGDCTATDRLAEIIDPDGEYYERTRGVKTDES